MLKLTKRKKGEKECIRALRRFCKYISDSDHRNHRPNLKKDSSGKVVCKAINHNCPEQTEEAFIQTVLKRFNEYLKSRKGKRGKRTRERWWDLCYRTPLCVKLTDLERSFIEKIIIQRIAPDSPCRTAWHICPDTGSADLHIIVCAITRDGPPKVTVSSRFGGKDGENIFAALANIDKEIAEKIRKNEEQDASRTYYRVDFSTPIEKRLKSKGRKKGAPSKLAKLLAELPYNISITNLEASIRKVGHQCSKPDKKGVTIYFDGNQRPFWHSLPRLFKDIAMAKSKSKGKNPPEKPKHSKDPDAPADPDDNDSPQDPT